MDVSDACLDFRATFEAMNSLSMFQLSKSTFDSLYTMYPPGFRILEGNNVSLTTCALLEIGTSG